MSVSKTGSGDHRSALLAGYLGWTLDAFDFFLVIFCLTAIGREFHKTDAQIALTITVTLAMRPLGAFLFGLIADRYGRRLPLMIDLVFYSIVEVLSGLAPSYTTFFLLRALFGIGMGGEWGVGASLAMEKAPPKSRGLMSGFLQEGYATGYLLAAICYFFVFPRVGWRPLFFLGGLPALLALFVRMRVKESEVWERGKRLGWGELGRTLLSHWKLFLYMAFLMMGMNLVSHGTQDMYPTLLERQWGFTAERRAVMTGISMIGAILGGVFFGGVSDRIGRRKTMTIALLVGIAVIPLWAFAPSVALLGIGAFLLQFMVQGAWGVIPAHLAELSPDSVRGFLPGFGYQVGVLLASAIGYVQALFANRTSYAVAMAGTAAVVMMFAIIAIAVGKEKGGAEFGR
ncbi:MAG TPA: MFS transporter [Candidatus Limnocylindrales bacterium]|nr:MFS transporter [Candidatus Limnocylindrales bacterium]